MSWVNTKSPVIDKLKTLTFNGGFVWLCLIPMICQALDVIELITGIVGQLSVLVAGAFLNNGRKLWNNDKTMISNNSTISSANSLMLKEYLSLCLKLTKFSKKTIIIYALITLAANLFMFKTCLCFYNS